MKKDMEINKPKGMEMSQVCPEGCLYLFVLVLESGKQRLITLKHGVTLGSLQNITKVHKCLNHFDQTIRPDTSSKTVSL